MDLTVTLSLATLPALASLGLSQAMDAHLTPTVSLDTGVVACSREWPTTKVTLGKMDVTTIVNVLMPLKENIYVLKDAQGSAQSNKAAPWYQTLTTDAASRSHVVPPLHLQLPDLRQTTQGLEVPHPPQVPQARHAPPAKETSFRTATSTASRPAPVSTSSGPRITVLNSVASVKEAQLLHLVKTKSPTAKPTAPTPARVDSPAGQSTTVPSSAASVEVQLLPQPPRLALQTTDHVQINSPTVQPTTRAHAVVLLNLGPWTTAARRATCVTASSSL